MELCLPASICPLVCAPNNANARKRNAITHKHKQTQFEMIALMWPIGAQLCWFGWAGNALHPILCCWCARSKCQSYRKTILEMCHKGIHNLLVFHLIRMMEQATLRLNRVKCTGEFLIQPLAWRISWLCVTCNNVLAESRCLFAAA